MIDTGKILWQHAEVKAPQLEQALPVVVARDIPYVPNANCFQNLSIYLPETAASAALVDTPVTCLPLSAEAPVVPRVHVHIHGGAWRDPFLTSTSIEGNVANAFEPSHTSMLDVIVSFNYTLTCFPTHATNPYDPIKDNHTDLAREAVHPQHVSDALRGFALLRQLGLKDGSYVLTGHSCGACIAFQTVLQPPSYWGLSYLEEPPTPAALIGLNGLYDLPDLVHNLGPSHAHMSAEYKMLIGNAFGRDESQWPAWSPARVDPEALAKRVAEKRAPPYIVVDQSPEDQLVPMRQADAVLNRFGKGKAPLVRSANRCHGKHAAPWEEGYMIFDSVWGVLTSLENVVKHGVEL